MTGKLLRPFHAAALPIIEVLVRTGLLTIGLKGGASLKAVQMGALARIADMRGLHGMAARYNRLAVQLKEESGA